VLEVETTEIERHDVQFWVLIDYTRQQIQRQETEIAIYRRILLAFLAICFKHMEACNAELAMLQVKKRSGPIV